jgi:hypothetical protein
MGFDHAVIVCGHSVLIDPCRFDSDEGWALLEFQRGEPAFYVEHIRCGVERAGCDDSALLVMSGGQTRRAAGPRSEAAGYFEIAERRGWFGYPEARARAITEEFARDSFENLLFGICRFREYCGAYPARISLISWEFKRERFHLHCESIRFPAERFFYCGPNNPRDLDQAIESERRALSAYRADPYSAGARFRAKRAERNPFRRQHGYSISCPEVAALFQHQGPELYQGAIPWSTRPAT